MKPVWTAFSRAGRALTGESPWPSSSPVSRLAPSYSRVAAPSLSRAVTPAMSSGAVTVSTVSPPFVYCSSSVNTYTRWP